MKDSDIKIEGVETSSNILKPKHKCNCGGKCGKHCKCKNKKHEKEGEVSDSCSCERQTD